MSVRPKKHLGQHFLTDENIAKRIVSSIEIQPGDNLLEIGPGKGVLTKYIINNKEIDFKVAEIDSESVEYLSKNYPDLYIIHDDILKIELRNLTSEKIKLIGNLPYNISNQIFFKIYDNKHLIDECVFMIQKEVAERICSAPGNKTYGILSVLLQAYFDIDYLFTVKPGVFFPPPKVNSSVIRLKRNNTAKLDCDESLFFKIIKATFNKRRKTIKNGLKDLFEINFEDNLLKKRAEQLDVANFVDLTKMCESLSQ